MTAGNGKVIKSVSVKSIYGADTREPHVEMEVGRFTVAMPPDDARDLALNLLQAAEAALSDAFLVEFVIQTGGGDETQAAGLLREFRAWRAERESHENNRN